jgi:hypothetical protein
VTLAALARQLHVEPFRSCFDYYCNGEGRWDHAAEIRKYCGFVEFSDPFAGFRLNRWLYALCWTGTDRPSALFDRATTWLITHEVLLPGVSVSPMVFEHINLLGRYAFSVPDAVQRGELRPLRSASDALDDVA